MPIVDPADALAELDRLLQSTIACPTLSSAELQTILDKYKRGSLWAANRMTQIGDVVIPVLVNRNGHRYRAVAYTGIGTDQKTGTTEPAWSTIRDNQITDNHVRWQEDGYDWGAVLWDFISAAREGWLIKAAKVSDSIDIGSSQKNIKPSQVYDHCVAMALKYNAAWVL